MKSNIYEFLVFARRDIETIDIISFVNILGPYSFENCKLEDITFPNNSELERIEKKSLKSTS